MASNATQTFQAFAIKLFSLLSMETLYESMITTTDLKPKVVRFPWERSVYGKVRVRNSNTRQVNAPAPIRVL